MIGSRAESLSRFTAAYAQLAKLPPPRFAPVVLKPLLQRVAGLETRVPVALRPGPDVTLDGRQPISSSSCSSTCCATPPRPRSTPAATASSLGWRPSARGVDIWVDDEGPGPPKTANLFVPFFTTKPGGSGIGLVLCRQIAEAHGGTLALDAGPGGRGCRAILTLPI